MGIFVGGLQVNDGIVLVSDVVTSEKNEPNIFKINAHNVALLAEDYKSGNDFCEKYLKKFENTDWKFTEIVKHINETLSASNDFNGIPIGLAILGYDEDFKSCPIVGFLYDGKTPNKLDLSKGPSVFSTENTLANYLTSKIYSEFMSMEDAMNLMAYISMQYNMILHTGKGISMATITKNGFKKIDESEIQKIIRICEKADLNLKKDFSDFFLKEMK